MASWTRGTVVSIELIAALAAAVFGGPGRAFAEEAADPAAKGSCLRPLLESDMRALDKVADGRLFLVELGPGDLDCLVERLVRTKDPAVRGCFRQFIRNDVWEAVREKLLAIEKRPAPEADLAERVGDLLAKEYSGDAFFVGGSLGYVFDNDRLATTFDGATDRLDVESQSLRLGVSADGAFNAGSWKIEPSLSASGTQTWSAESAKTGGEPSHGSARSFQGVGGGAGISILRRDEKLKLDGMGQYATQLDPPPGAMAALYGAGGSLEVRELGGSALSLKASADWCANDLAPLGDGYFDPFMEMLSLYGEAAYMWAAAGLLAVYEHASFENTGAVFQSAVASDAGSLIVHIPVAFGFVRVGAGGGAWSEESRQIGSAASESAGGEIHARLEGELAATDHLRFDVGLEVRANESDGTFVGWYPSGGAHLGASLSLGDLTLSLMAGAGGDIRELNLEQKSFSFGAGGEATYSPRDFFRVSLSGNWNLSKQYGYDAQSSSCWSAAAMVGLRLAKTIDLWLTTNGQISGSSYETQGGFGQESGSAAVMEQISMRY